MKTLAAIVRPPARCGCLSALLSHPKPEHEVTHTSPQEYCASATCSIDVKTIRESFELTQSGFAARFAIPLRDWEQHRRKPSGMARLFLLLLAREPAAVRRVLASLVRWRSGGRRGERRVRPAALAGGRGAPARKPHGARPH